MKSTIITTHLSPRLSRRVAVDEEPLFFCTKIPPSFFCNVRLFFYFLLFLIEKLLWWPETRRQQTPLNRVVAFYFIYIFWEWISLFYVVGFAHKRAEQQERPKGIFMSPRRAFPPFGFFIVRPRSFNRLYPFNIWEKKPKSRVLQLLRNFSFLFLSKDGWKEEKKRSCNSPELMKANW